jgi:hypothetical protein
MGIRANASNQNRQNVSLSEQDRTNLPAHKAQPACSRQGLNGSNGLPAVISFAYRRKLLGVVPSVLGVSADKSGKRFVSDAGVGSQNGISADTTT